MLGGEGLESVPALVCVPPEGKVCPGLINRNILGARSAPGVISIPRNPGLWEAGVEDKGPGQEDREDERRGDGGRVLPANETMQEKPRLNKPFLPTAHLPMQGTRVRSLLRENPTYCGIPKPKCHY